MNQVAHASAPNLASLGRRLRRVVTRAHARVLAYQHLWRRAGIPAEALAIHEPTDLGRLPVTQRESLEAFSVDERRDWRWPRALLRIERSGGSTGTPFAVPVDPITHLRRQLRFLRAALACGYRPGDRFLMLTTRPTGRHPTLPGCFCMNVRADQRALARIYTQFQPRVLYGPLNALLVLADELNTSASPCHRPAVVIATAEQLGGADRARLQRTFGSDPADFYGSTEAGLVAWRLPGMRQFRTASRDLHMEFLPAQTGGGLEHLVLTDLRPGTCMPLVRFDTGDLVARDLEHPEQPIVGFRGRIVDSLRRADGRPVSAYRVTLLLEAIPEVTRYQVVQRPDGRVDAYVGDETAQAQETAQGIHAGLAELMGPGVTIRVHMGTRDVGAGQRKLRPVRTEVEDKACAS
ncbi:hypothetical protein [Aquisalimonas sp.]|uniref:hypothetical protein n=1 Tax=Aquisalimonas sp. TaxID=1872621 RepID=UPI0025C4E4D8|nr:hypothetical protein [Aquisalimonas sp.]